MGNFFSDVGKVFTAPAELFTKVWDNPVVDMFTGKGARDDARDAQREAQATEMANWYKQQEYNTPANQVARLRAAGLNVGLAYDKTSTGNATSAPSTFKRDVIDNRDSLLNYAFQAMNLINAQKEMSLRETATLANIQHSQDALDFAKKKWAVEEAFRDSDLNFRKERWNWEKDYIENHGTKPGSATGYVDSILSSILGKPTTDAMTDTHNLLNESFRRLFDPVGSLMGLGYRLKGAYNHVSKNFNGSNMSKIRY